MFRGRGKGKEKEWRGTLSDAGEHGKAMDNKQEPRGKYTKGGEDLFVRSFIDRGVKGNPAYNVCVAQGLEGMKVDMLVYITVNMVSSKHLELFRLLQAQSTLICL